MKEKLWLFIVKFILVSAPLALLWYWKAGAWYLVFLNHVYSNLFVKVLGFDIKFFAPPADVFYGLIAFVSLMIITRGIDLRTRLRQVLLGILITVLWHLVLTEAVYLLHEDQGVPSAAYDKLSPVLYIFTGTLPFVLWVLFAPKQVAGLFLRPKKKD
ncbi:MAG: hypothetical protein WBF13_12565 [Candidatus Zixiibacteriota bacterium]